MKIVASFLLLLTTTGLMGQTDPQPEIWSLERCINYARKNNLMVRNSELTQLNNEINLKQSKWSLAPNLNAGGSLGKSFGRTVDPVSNRFVSRDFLSGGISLDDKDQIQLIRDKRVVAVDVNSGFEIQPGVKDTSKLRQFLS